jgi:acyl-coenzyme A synthetase/AMP-(fatty) acid ligase
MRCDPPEGTGLDGWGGELTRHAHSLLHHGFLNQTLKAPSRIALTDESSSLSYGSLFDQARRLATLLDETAGSSRRPIVIAGDKRNECVIAMIAALLTGRPYATLYPGQRTARLVQMTASLRPSLVVDLGSREEDYNSRAIAGGAPLLHYPQALPERVLEPAINAAGAAYCLFTSGSSGVPRGVIISHAAACAAQRTFIADTDLSASDRVCNEVALCFDVSTFDLFATFAVGGSIDLTPECVLDRPAAFADYLAAKGITSLFTVPTVAMELLEATPDACKRLCGLKRLLLTGELISQKLGRLMSPLLASGTRIHNEYGATEFPFGLSCALRKDDLCRPNVLNPSRHGDATSVHLSSSGEILIQGHGLMSGHVTPSTDFTASFPPLACYRTGDFAKMLPDGRYLFLGRRDRQVRHLGHRVELAEIETAAEKHPDVELACVFYHVHTKEFVAYITPKKGRMERLTSASLRKHLRELVPGYMIPRNLCIIDMMPRTHTGKKHYRALEAPSLTK